MAGMGPRDPGTLAIVAVARIAVELVAGEPQQPVAIGDQPRRNAGERDAVLGRCGELGGHIGLDSARRDATLRVATR